jgi:anthranilate synthase component 1
MKHTSFEEFVELATRGTFVPVYKEILADLLTPAAAFLKVAEHADYAFLLESVEGGERIARYSFLGKDPFLVLRARNGRTVLERAGETEVLHEPFIEALRRLMAEYRSPVVPDLPRLTGGAVGFFGYDAAPWFEPALDGVWQRERERLGDPAAEAAFMLFDTVLAFDHVRHRILLIANARVTPGESLESLYQFACARIQFLERELAGGLSRATAGGGDPPVIEARTTRAEFEAAVRTAKEHIAAGDIYQVVLSQRYDVRVSADPFTVYRALRHVNPSPYMYFLRVGDVSIVGSSPEMLVRVEGRHVETHPIAGTRPRGATHEEDLRLGEELKRDEKERAEHVMLVDLGRNDIGRVCDYGTVRVPQYMTIDRYSHVMHLVSRVEGRLSADKDRLDALVACFPAGTVSGAPKIRAMEIIAALEPSWRGHPHAGAARRCRPGAGRGRHRRRLRSGDGVRRDPEQGAGPPARPRARAAGAAVMVLLIDNYDSFTFNLAQYLGELGAEVSVRRNDQITLDEIAALAPSRLVISPGPGRPEDAGISIAVIKRFGPTLPILGVCLGHQAMGAAFGGQVVRASRLMHGKSSIIEHDGKGVFAGLTAPFPAARYHSLVVSEDGWPAALEITARTKDAERTVMALRHREWPMHGVQFHPESILTEEGRRLLRNFLEL